MHMCYKMQMTIENFLWVPLLHLHTSYFFIFVFLWFCLESQSDMKRSGPGLYSILTLNWCILRRHCSLCDSVAMAFLNIATNGL